MRNRFELSKIHTDIQKHFSKKADQQLVKKYSRFFKEGYDAYGLTEEILHTTRDELFSKYNFNIKECLLLGDDLIATGKYEEASLAFLLMEKLFSTASLSTFEHIGDWFETGICNWAHCDIFSGRIIGQLLEKRTITLDNLVQWRTSGAKFKRRAVPVSMINLLKTTEDYDNLFCFIEPMMEDKERVVHQGLGWFLREAWKINPVITEEFLFKWKNTAARLIFQYATEKMKPEERARFKKQKA